MRYGRLNMVDVLADHVVKTCVVKETSRPKKLLVEKWALDQARLEGIQTPQVISYSDHGNETLIMQRVRGTSLGREVTLESLLAFAAIGEQLAARRQDHLGYGWIDPTLMQGAYNSWVEFLCDYTERYTEPLVRRDVINTTLQKKVLKAISHYHELRNTPSSLVHRDIKPGNIVWGDQGAFLIDWENVILGDPFYDLCVYRCRFGTGRRWDRLAAPINSASKRVENLYLAIALIGVIDFCITYGYGIKQKSKQLYALAAYL